jgi:hypothetical protein
MEAEPIRTTPAECIQALDLILRMQFVDALGPASRLRWPFSGFQKPYREFESHTLRQCSLERREIRLDFSGNCGKWAKFRNYPCETGQEKVSPRTL